MKLLFLTILINLIECRNYSNISSESENDSDSVIGPIFAFLIGFLMIFSAFPCLWFNERR